MRILLLIFGLASLSLQAQSFFGREANTGQFPADILFFQRSSSYGLQFTRDALRLSRGIEVQLENIAPQASPTLADVLPTNYNLYPGNNPAKRVKSAKQYRTFSMPNAYPGINVSWRGGFADGFERLTFNLSPGIDPSIIRVRFKNAGDKPFEGPGGIWFTGGAVPGVFIATIAASQGNPEAPLAATLTIANSDTLTISTRLLDRNSGALRSSTYAPLNLASGLNSVIPASNRDILAGGASFKGESLLGSGFLIRWRPAENRFFYTLALPDPIRALSVDTSSTTYYATYSTNLTPARLRIAAVNESGSPVYQVASRPRPVRQRLLRDD